MDQEPLAPPPMLTSNVDPLEDPNLPSALTALRDRLDQEKKYRHATTYALSLAVFVVLFLVGVVGVTQAQRNDDRINQSRNACAVGNKLRGQLRNMGTSLNMRSDRFIDTLVAASAAGGGDKDLTQAQKDQSAIALAAFRRLDQQNSDEVKSVIAKIADNDCKALYK